MAPLPHLTGPDLAALAADADVVGILEEALMSGAVDPEDDSPRLFSPAPGGEFLMMPASAAAWSGVKLVTVVPGNPARGKPKIQGVYTLFSSDDLAPVALMDAVELTLLRTPATTVPAVRHLLAAGGVRDAAALPVVVFGTGPQAERHLRCLRAVLGTVEAVVVGRRPGSAEAFAERVTGSGLRVRGGQPSDVRDAAVVLCAASSATPVLADGLVPGDAVVAAVGSHGTERAELPSELVRRSDVVVEARAAAMLESGNLLGARSPEEWSKLPVANLADPVSGRFRRTPGRPAVFSGTGMAWEDLVVATALYDRHTSAQPAVRRRQPADHHNRTRCGLGEPMATQVSQTSVAELVAGAVSAGEAWAAMSAKDRAAVLAAVAEALDAAADELVPIARRETHLTEPRLRGELARTTFQIRLLAESAVAGEHLDIRVDHADPDWPMGAPRPDLRRSAVPLGPVVVFAASDSPFAFSVAGGDTASALAAGCPVIVKAHGGHPDLSDATARTVAGALRAAGAPEGLFALVHRPDEAREALTHPEVKAGAFTGSIPAGRALFDIAQSRPEPIPFYGELGSVNPVLVTRRAAARRAAEVVDGFVTSFTTGAGQFCTKPGVLLAPADSEITSLLREAVLPEAAPLLNDRIAEGHQHIREQLEAKACVDVLAAGTSPDLPAPRLLVATVENVLDDLGGLFTECFGPTALVVTYHDETQLLEFARRIDGQLTATVAAEADDEIVPQLVDLLARKAGRLLWNQWPTGVSVTYAQQRGGPYPATTAPGTTSVGTAALTRFVRPVAWQGFPQHLLPGELRDIPTSGVVRRIDGRVPGQE